MTNVLYISYDGMTDPLGQSQVLPYLSGLSKKGYIFDLISFEKLDRYQSSKKLIETICNESQIKWHPLKYTKNPPIISTFLDVKKMRQKAKEICEKENISIVHCRSYISSIIGLELKEKNGLKFIFDMRGFWADERVDGKLWNLRNPIYNLIYKYFKKKEIKFLKDSDYTISLTHSGVKEIMSWPKIISNELKISVIPCCSDLKLFNDKSIDYGKREKFKLKEKLLNKKILGYVGSVGTWYMLDEMLLFFKAQKIKKANLHFLFITKDSPIEILQRAKIHNIPSSDITITSSSRSDMPTYMSIFDFSVFFIKPCFSKKASSPTKQGELMSLGIPVIVNEGVGDTSFVVKKYKSGISINKFSEEELKKINLEWFC